MTAAFLLCVSAVQVGVHSGFCVLTRDSASLCVQVGHIPGVCCLNFVNIFLVLLQVCVHPYCEFDLKCGRLVCDYGSVRKCFVFLTQAVFSVCARVPWCLEHVCVRGVSSMLAVLLLVCVYMCLSISGTAVFSLCGCL